jgi:hypothetical protein
MAQRPYRLLGLPETRSLTFLIKISPGQVEGYLDYLQPRHIKKPINGKYAKPTLNSQGLQELEL